MSAPGKALLGLHAWGGLLFGWLLVPVFLAGSLAVFGPEIDHWMKAELSAPDFSRETAVALGEARLRGVAPDAAVWRIRLPSGREPTIGIGWGSDPRQMREETLDAASGQPLHERPTHGGHLFTDFHAELLAGVAGKWIVGAAGIVMLAALVSGVLVHQRLLRDFFTFRPWATRRRAWLDAHNLAGVATLPFLLMIAWTGVVILAEAFMPAATHYLYDGKPRANRADVVSSFVRPPAGEAATMRPLVEHLAAAEAILGARTVSNLLVRHPDDRNALVQALRHVDDRLAAVADHVTFDAASGEVFGRQTEWNAMAYAYRAQVGLHVVHFGGPALRWLYFASGLLGTAMMAAGIVLFARKRRLRAGGARSQRLVDSLGVAAVAGALIACLVYLYAGRLLPATLDARPDWELACFFGAWGASWLHALRQAPESAWRRQLMLAGGLALFLPQLDLLTALQPLDALRLGVDLAALALGGALLLAARRCFGVPADEAAARRNGVTP